MQRSCLPEALSLAWLWIPSQPRRIDVASRLEADPHFPGLVMDLEAIGAG
jgi:hypothetical protein